MAKKQTEQEEEWGELELDELLDSIFEASDDELEDLQDSEIIDFKTSP